ncbi:MAG: hypothetical protein QG673_1758, partial [Pseudomonadota bacterium]|nr:hypothetical protein [Pseudomonadota bacterium]
MIKTTDDRLLNVEELTWEKAGPIIETVAPHLVEAIDELPPEKRFPFYKASYHFGTQIIDQNGVYLPLADGDNISFNDPHLPDSIKKGLGYITGKANPIGLTLNKKC